jgi:hypothetical protein
VATGRLRDGGGSGMGPALFAYRPWLPDTSMDIDDHLHLDPPLEEWVISGADVQHRYRQGAVAYDCEDEFLYVLELFADEAKPVIHVWTIEG